MATHSPVLVCIGNPLLDIQVDPAQGPAYLEKYGLKSNDAILAEEKHMPISNLQTLTIRCYDDVVANAKVTYVAGGAGQNAARSAAYVLPEGTVSYIGSVGDDDLMQTLRQANDAEGVHSAYQIHPSPSRTGACAVIISGHDRSLVTTLRAAEQFSIDHLAKPEVADLLSSAKYFYIEGYFLTHGVESALLFAKKASTSGKTVALNLSAPFIPQFFKVQLEEILPHVDVLIGNENEYAAYAEAAGMGKNTPLSQVATALAGSNKSNAARPRLVVVTQGADSTLVASSSPSVSAGNLAPTDENPKTYPVPKLSSDKIVDTNGAGDMFAGGFMGALAQGKSLDECIEVGHKLGQMCCGQIGPKLEYPKQSIF